MKSASIFLVLMFAGAHALAMNDEKDWAADYDEALIRLVFLGKTGAGKSTAINACYNFVQKTKWNDYPKWFPIPTEYQECNVEDYRERAVENYRRGQLDAVTQEPSEYVATGPRFTLSLIDCPGMGDPRGIGQDRSNTDAIAHFLMGREHCNAFCIVFKSTVNRGTIEERYCVEQIKTLLPLDVRERIFIIVTHDTGARENLGTFVEEMDLPSENIFYFDNWALTQAGHIALNNIEFITDDSDTNKDVEDPFKEPERQRDDHAVTVARKVRNSWLKSHQEFNRMIRKAKELNKYRLNNFMFIRIESLKSDFTEAFLLGIDAAKSLEAGQARLAEAQVAFTNASSAKTRAEEAYNAAYEEYTRRTNETAYFISDTNVKSSIAMNWVGDTLHGRMLWEQCTPLIEQAYRYAVQNRNLEEAKNQKLSAKWAAEDELNAKEVTLHDVEWEVRSLQRHVSYSISGICSCLLRLKKLAMCALNSQLGNYYDVYIRREPIKEKKEELIREKKLFLDVMEKYREEGI